MTTDGIIFEYLMAGGIVIISGFSIATYKQIGKIKDEINNKVFRIYSRLDEVKEKTEEKFVFKDICKILHEQTAKDIIEIKLSLRELLRIKDNNKDE